MSRGSISWCGAQHPGNEAVVCQRPDAHKGDHAAADYEIKEVIEWD